MRVLSAALAVAGICLGVWGPTHVAAQGSPVQTVKGGILDEVKLFVQKLPSARTVAMRPFSASDADITEGEKKDETKKMQPIAPGILADEFVARLKPIGPFADVVVLTGDVV